MSASLVTADRLEWALACWRAASPGTMMEHLPLSLAGCRPETNTALLRFDPMPGWMSNTFGAMHGGLVATLLDSAMGLHAFAATGDPNHPGIPAWPQATAESVPTMCFDTVTDLRVDYDRALMEAYPPPKRGGFPGSGKMYAIFGVEPKK